MNSSVCPISNRPRGISYGVITAKVVKMSTGLQEPHDVPAMKREVKQLTVG